MLALLLRTVAIDPVIGTWTLGAAKPSFDPGPPPKTQTRVYEQTAGGMKMTLTATTAAGRQVHVEYTAREDGKDCPRTGSPSVNSLSLERVDALRGDAVEKKDGVAKVHVTRTIAPDGQTMTMTSIGANGSGAPVKNALVFHRQ